MQCLKSFRFIKTLVVLLAFALLVAMAPTLAEASPQGSSSTNPILISTAAELNSIHATETQPYYYKLTADISLDGYQGANATEHGDSITGWDPIGDNTKGDNGFGGYFIGGGHKISGLIINDTGRVLAYAGLFGFIGAGASVTGVILENPSVASNSYDVEAGALAGYNAGAISGCAANGASITGIEYCMGGLVGYNDGTWNGSITDCYATGSVTGDGDEGGLVGHNGSSDGDGYSASISDSYAAVNVNGGGPYDVPSDNGGLVGLNTCNDGYASINDCYATGSVNSSGAGDNGGLVGYNSGDYDGPVGPGGYGYAASITDAFATGSVTGGAATDGGLVGLNSNDGSYAYITDSYCIKVAGQNVVGSDSGNNGFSGQPNNSDSNSETTAAMQQKSTFTNSTTNSAPWDYTNTWAINEDYSYPYLLQVPPAPLPTVTASANPSSEGTVNGLATYDGAYNVGDQVTVEAVSNNVYNFINWTSDGNAVSSAVYYTFTMPESSVVLTANFSTVPSGATTTPSVQTDAASSLTGSAATLNGDITSNGGASITSYGYYYGASSNNLTGETDVTVGASDYTGSYSANISGLSPGQTYYFEAFAANSVGTSYGTPLNFTTSSGGSTLSSDDTLSNLSLMYGTLSPIFTPGTLTYTAGEVYGTTSDRVTAVAGSVDAQVYINNISGTQQLIPLSVGDNPVAIKVYAQDGTNQIYSLTIYVPPSSSSSGGGGGGAPSYPPTVQTEAASTVTTDSAVLSGDITSDNGYDITDYGFLWGTSSSGLTNKLDVGSNNQSGAFTDTLSGLTAGTTYYFQAYATNSYGTADGTVLNFTATAPQTTTPTTTATPPTFPDVSTSFWGYNAITNLAGLGYVSGYPDGNFDPNNQITRAEFCAIMDKVLNLTPYTPQTPTFTDVNTTTGLTRRWRRLSMPGLPRGTATARSIPMPRSPGRRSPAS
jgi:hypothetical protein